MLSAIIYLYAGLLFFESTRGNDQFPIWTYLAIIFAWPVAVPVAFYLYRRGK